MLVNKITSNQQDSTNKTLGEFLPLYLIQLLRKNTTQKTFDNHAASVSILQQALGDIKMCELRPVHFGQLYSSVRAKYPQAANKLLIECKSVLQEALVQGWIDANPCESLHSAVAQVKRSRLTLDAWKEIYAYAKRYSPPWLAPAMLLALVTAQRRGDIAAMQYSQIYGHLLYIQQEKTGARIALPLKLYLPHIGQSILTAVLASVEYIAHSRSKYLVHKENGSNVCTASLSFRFQQARDAVGVLGNKEAPPTFHEQRSLAERLYGELGINTRLLLGHTNWKQTLAYDNDRGLSSSEYTIVQA